MSKNIYLFSLVLLALAFVSCSETEEVDKYHNWRARNEAFIDSLQNVYDTKADHGGLSRLQVISAAPGEYIYYKVKESAPAGNVESPKSTDYVKVYYKGTNILGEYFDGTFTGADPVEGATNPTAGDSPTAIFLANELIKGWGEVLQRMKTGDRWVAYIPWKYGYGSSDKSSIKAYSTLIFDLKLKGFSDKKENL